MAGINHRTAERLERAAFEYEQLAARLRRAGFESHANGVQDIRRKLGRAGRSLADELGGGK